VPLSAALTSSGRCDFACSTLTGDMIWLLHVDILIIPQYLRQNWR
jgi:hypothetical protein